MRRSEGDLSVSIEIIINAISYRFGHGHPLPSSPRSPRVVGAAASRSGRFCLKRRPRRIQKEKKIPNKVPSPPSPSPPPPSHPPPVLNSFQTAAKFLLIKLHPHRSFHPDKILTGPPPAAAPPPRSSSKEMFSSKTRGEPQCGAHCGPTESEVGWGNLGERMGVPTWGRFGVPPPPARPTTVGGERSGGAPQSPPLTKRRGREQPGWEIKQGKLFKSSWEVREE